MNSTKLPWRQMIGDIVSFPGRAATANLPGSRRQRPEVVQVRNMGTREPFFYRRQRRQPGPEPSADDADPVAQTERGCPGRSAFDMTEGTVISTKGNGESEGSKPYKY